MDRTTALLNRCLRLMLRATPHPDDRDQWQDTLRQAAIDLDRAADRAATKSFWPLAVLLWLAITMALLAMAWLATPVEAQSRVTWHDRDHHGLPSVMELLPPSQPRAVADLRFLNQDLHNFRQTQVTLTLGDITVTVALEINIDGPGSDRITVTPPPGFIAVPASLIVPEGASGIITIYPLTLQIG